jgi:hypothetical protein
MIHSGSISIKCPMCEHNNVIHSDVLTNTYHARPGIPFTFLCDNEEGGCDRYFVTIINLIPSVHTYTYRDEVKE